MTEPKPCIRCQRGIDAWARICPYCNWDQQQAPPANEPQRPAAAVDYVPPSENNLKKKAIMAGAGVLLLVVSFGVGMLINSDGAPERAPEPLVEQAAEHNAENKPRRADTPLVPVGAGGIEQPITSAPNALPAPGAAAPAGSEYDRTDATAVSAIEYAEMAKRAKAEKDRMAAVVDPRSITGPAYAQAPVNPRPRRVAPVRPQQPGSGGESAASPVRRASSRTRPVPQYQPIPSMRGRGTAKFVLLVGPDGNVRQVSVARPLQDGNTGQLLSSIQRWRFKPATENGEPVAAPYSVEISFKQ